MNRSASEPETSTPVLTKWTKDDKYLLLEALKCYGSDDIENVSKSVNKSVEETKAALKYYRKRALKHVPPSVKSKKVASKHSKHSVPLDNWAKLAAESSSYHNQQTESVNMASAFRLIAQFEDIPDAKDTNNINFREVYDLIANALDGKKLNDNTNTKFIIEKCIIETALFSKSFIDKNDLVCALDHIYNSQMAHFREPRDLEMATLKHLIKQKFYNPFNISEEYLKPTNNVNHPSTP